MGKVFKNRFGEMRSGWKIALVMLVFLAIQIGIGMVVGIGMLIYSMASGKLNNLLSLSEGGSSSYIDILNNSPFINLFNNVIGFIAMLTAVVIILKTIDKKPLEAIGVSITSKSMKELLYGLLLGAISMSLIFFFLLYTGNLELKGSLLNPSFSIHTLTGIVVFILVGINEELFSRGYCMMVLQQTRNKWAPVLISSIIFSLLHLANPNVKFLGLVNIFLVGVLFAYMVVKTGTIMMPIGYHITWNYFQGNVFGFAVSGTAPSGIYTIQSLKDNILTGGAFGPEAGILTTVVIIIGIFVVSRYSRRSEFLNVFSSEI